MQDSLQPRAPTDSGKAIRYVVAAILLREDEILIGQRRPDQAMALKWEFPGGKVEPGETAEQALYRELEEELGILAEIGERIAHIQHVYRSGGTIDLQFFLVQAYQGELTNQVFKDLRWCTTQDLVRYDFLAADRTLIRDLASGKILLKKTSQENASG